MNPIGAVLDLLLLGLLGWALVLGLKLNGRLKALRDGQEGFAKAVTELDGASRRAEAGLAEIRRAAEETHDALLGRIETARGLLARLEAAAETAARTVPVPAPRSEVPTPLRGRGEDRAPLPRAKPATEAARAGATAPEPGGFADMIRRTLREPR